MCVAAATFRNYHPGVMGKQTWKSRGTRSRVRRHWKFVDGTQSHARSHHVGNESVIGAREVSPG